MTQLVMEPDSSEEEQKAKGKKGKKEKKVAVKKEAKEPTLEGVLVTAASKDLLAQEPMKAFMLRAQHRLRAYIAQVNAWPRKQGNSIEKREVPEEMIIQTLRQNTMYQTREFLAVFNKMWSDLSVREAMIKQVSVRSHGQLQRLIIGLLWKQVYKAAAQLRQEVKQKAKRSIEKAFLTFSLPQHQGSSPVGSVSRAAEFRQVKEARIKFVRENDLFHHGNVQMPDPSTDPLVCGRILSARPCSLTVASSGWQIRDGRSTGRSLQTSRPTSGGWGPTPRPCARRTWSCSTSTMCLCRAT